MTPHASALPDGRRKDVLTEVVRPSPVWSMVAIKVMHSRNRKLLVISLDVLTSRLQDVMVLIVRMYFQEP